jgi:hypothetical protein
MQHVAPTEPVGAAHHAPIIGLGGELLPDAFQVLFGHMLFPDSIISASHYSAILRTEFELGLAQIEADDPGANEPNIPGLSFSAEALIKEANKRSRRALRAAQVVECYLHLDHQGADASIRKAVHMVGLRNHRRLRRSNPKDLADAARKDFRFFRRVAHYWAVWFSLDEGRQSVLRMSGAALAPDVLLDFLGVSEVFASRLLASPSGRRFVDLLRSPAGLAVPTFELSSMRLDPRTLEDLSSYRPDEAR